MTASSMVFIGGGNMAGALIGGLLRAGRPPASILVVEPVPAQRERLAQQFGVTALAAASASLRMPAMTLTCKAPAM